MFEDLIGRLQSLNDRQVSVPIEADESGGLAGVGHEGSGLKHGRQGAGGGGEHTKSVRTTTALTRRP
jgi:hypothetical protein